MGAGSKKDKKRAKAAAAGGITAAVNEQGAAAQFS